MKSIILYWCIISTGVAMGQGIKKEYINPGNGYTQTVTITTGNVKTIYISGQVGKGANLEEQIRSAFLNVKKQLQDAGADYKDLVKTNTYIVDYKEEDLTVFRSVRNELMGSSNMPASTLVGVHSLARKQYLVEIDAIAIIQLN